MFLISLLFLLVAISVILKFAPVGTDTKPLDGAEKKYLRQKVLIYLSIEFIAIIVLFDLDLYVLGYVISLGVIVSAVLVIFGHKKL